MSQVQRVKLPSVDSNYFLIRGLPNHDNKVKPMFSAINIRIFRSPGLTSGRFAIVIVITSSEWSYIHHSAIMASNVSFLSPVSIFVRIIAAYGALFFQKQENQDKKLIKIPVR